MARHHSPACPRRVRPAPSYRTARGFPEGTSTRGRPYPQIGRPRVFLRGEKYRGRLGQAPSAFNDDGPRLARALYLGFASALPAVRARRRSPGPAGLAPLRRRYLISKEAPDSSSSPLSLSASSRSTPSLMGFGASSTSALASLRPSPVAARTTLMTWIFLSPAPERTTSNAVCSSASASSPPPPPAAGAAAATAVADTPNSSSSALMRSESSSTEMPLSSSIHSAVLVAMMFVSPPGSLQWCRDPRRDPPWTSRAREPRRPGQWCR